MIRDTTPSFNIFLLLFQTLLFIMLIWDVVFPSNTLVIIFLGLCLLPLLLKKSFIISIREIQNYVTIFLLILIIVTVHGSVYLNYSATLFNSNFKNILLSIQLLWILPVLHHYNKTAFVKAIDYALYILVLVFFIQVVAYYMTSEYLDVLKLFAGRPSKYLAYQSMLNQTGLNLIRPTSIFNEPGTYASYSFVLLSLSYLNHLKIKPIHYLTLLTYIFSLSAFGIFISSITLLFFFFWEFKIKKQHNKKVIKLVLLIIPILVFISFFLIKYIELRFSNDTTGAGGGLDFRFKTLELYLSNDINQRLIGLNFGYNQTENYFIQDTSLIFTIVLFLGLFTIPFFFLILKHFKYASKIIILFIIISLTKIDLFSYSFWFFISAAPLAYFSNLKR